MVAALIFLTHCNKEGGNVLKSILTGDETWVLNENSETKELSKQWMHTASPKKQLKFKQTIQKENNGYSFFLGPKRWHLFVPQLVYQKYIVLLVDFMEYGTTITKEVYRENLCSLKSKKHSKQLRKNALISHGFHAWQCLTSLQQYEKRSEKVQVGNYQPPRIIYHVVWT